MIESYSKRREILCSALEKIEFQSLQRTDGKWLEHLTVQVAPLISEWDICKAQLWDDWSGSREVGESYVNQPDSGIDVVAHRRDGKLVAIQCKSRRIVRDKNINSISENECNKFIGEIAVDSQLWAERWLVTNGPVSASFDLGVHDLRLLNLKAVIGKQLDLLDDEAQISRDKMQQEAIGECVKGLQENRNIMGRSRGKLILPCGTGKSRIALRIVEALTEPSQFSVVLCPSIALVSQLRREFIEYQANQSSPFLSLAVCSDPGVVNLHVEQKSLADDPTRDITASDINQLSGVDVTTSSEEIATWMRSVGKGKSSFGVIFGTYQSSHKIADALQKSKSQVQVLIADEAHRTAGLKKVPQETLEKKIRDFTICHDDEKFPTKYRLYQTATPKVYGEQIVQWAWLTSEWIVRDMDDQDLFGPELYRRSYLEAVNNGWLSDYRILAIGVNDDDAVETANKCAEEANTQALSTSRLLRGMGMTLVMAGHLREEGVVIKSSINFMNTIALSREMVRQLSRDEIRNWVQSRNQHLVENIGSAPPQETIYSIDYTFKHLDASSPIGVREDAKRELVDATEEHPFGIINVGIFGEGVDAPSLSAVGFLEPRKSPVDVIQAVGRVMRRSPKKKLGYIIVPILIPHNVDAELWMSNSSPDHGWQELGQILRALRAHDQRIEDNLSELMEIYIPNHEDDVATLIAIGGEDRRTKYWGHFGKPKTAKEALKKVLLKQAKPSEVFEDQEKFWQLSEEIKNEPENIITGQRLSNTGRVTENTIVMCSGSAVRDKPSKDGTHGKVDKVKTKEKALRILNRKEGNLIFPRKNRTTDNSEPRQNNIQQYDLWSKISDDDKQMISMNLLEKSGLSRHRQERDANLLQISIAEACRYLKEDDLATCLNKHFGLDHQNTENSADGCTIAALLLMNAMMLHQRIAVEKWFPGLKTMDALKASPNAKDQFSGQWNKITRHDFHPVFMPALDVIDVILEESGRLAGLNKALKHLATESERIAESYADMGSDHAGPLFNKVMGNQSSDGAFFTRPTTASLLAKLTLDAANEGETPDWTDKKTWKDHRSVDLACGSGTLISALMTDMKRRAREQKADPNQLGDLQKLAVEELIAGLDINPVSLQLAAAQMMSGAKQVKYKKMQLHQMPYGNDSDLGITVGSLELFGQKAILPRNDLGLEDEKLGAKQAQLGGEEDYSAKDEQLTTRLESAVEAVKDVRIVVMNPPFTNRTKMGAKFDKDIRKDMRRRIDAFSSSLVDNDDSMDGVANVNSIQPMFVALAEKCLSEQGIMAMINPTIALTAPSALSARKFLAERYHIHTLLTCHLPGQVNLSQNTGINESIIIAKRHSGNDKPPTRIINLDRFPFDEEQVEEFHKSLLECEAGLIPNGWGHVSEWPWKKIKDGDWSAAIWRSPKLAEETIALAYDKRLISLGELEMLPRRCDEVYSRFDNCEIDTRDGFGILKSKGSAAQRKIRGVPDEYRKPKRPNLQENIEVGTDHPNTQKLMKKAGHILLTAGQNSSTARLTSVVCEEPRVGIGWLPIPSEKLNYCQAKGLSVFLNSTLGRLQLMQNAGSTLVFPNYNPLAWFPVRVPDIFDPKILDTLVKCWEETKDMDVPQYREGEGKIDGKYNVRKLWDEAVAKVMDRSPKELEELRLLLHKEPHVCGIGYNQFYDSVE